MNSLKSTLLLLSIIVATFAHDHPMIGMISYPGSPSDKSSTSYIQGESAKFVEASGARNVAILYDQDWETTQSVLLNLNGIFIQNSFTGEMSNDATFLTLLENAYDYIVVQSALSIVYPLWTSGVTALQLSQVISSSNDLSTYTVPIDALDYPTTLNIIEHKFPNEKVTVTSNIRDDFLKHAFTKDIAYFNQDKGITLESLKKDTFLSEHFDVVATAKDRKGTEFIAIMKGKDIPVVMSFVLFEAVYNFYPHTNIPHSSEATRLSVQFSKAFTDFCRANDRTYGSIEQEYMNNLFNNKLTTVAKKEYQTFYF